MIPDLMQYAAPLLPTALFVYFAYISYQFLRYLRPDGRPFRLERHPPEAMPALAPELESLDALLHEHGFHNVGAETVQLLRQTKPIVAYHYIDDGGTYAELAATEPGKPALGLHTRFRDQALVMTSYPIGPILRTPTLITHYALLHPEVALDHHAKLVRAASRKKGEPLALRDHEDTRQFDEWFRRTHRGTFLARMRDVRSLLFALYLIGASLGIINFVLLLVGVRSAAVTLLSLALYACMVFFVLEAPLTNWLQRPPHPLDEGMPPPPARDARAAVADPSLHPLNDPGLREKVKIQKLPTRPVTLWRLGWLIPMAASVLLPLLLVFNMGFINQFSTAILARQGDGWTAIPYPGNRLRAMVASPDGAMWGLTENSIVRWDGTTWTTLHAVEGNAQEMVIDQGTLWAISQADIMRCESGARQCQTVYKLAGGGSIAAADGVMIAVSSAANAVVYDGESWDQFALGERLPGFDVGYGASYLAEVAITSDGTQWIEWGQLWRRADERDAWQPVLYGQPAPLRVQMIGTTPGRFWTEWSDGIGRDGPGLFSWDFSTWDDIGVNLSDAIFEIATAPDGTVWMATMYGLVRYAEGQFERESVPGADIVGELAFMPDGTLWVQTTPEGGLNWTVALFGGALLVFFFSMWRLGRKG